MDIIDFYKKVANASGLTTDEGGNIYIEEPNGDLSPVEVDGKKLVIPTKEQIRNTVETDDNGNIVVNKTYFHPLRENLVKLESTSLTKLRKHMAFNLNWYTGVIIHNIMSYMVSPKLQKKPTKTELELMDKIAQLGVDDIVDDKTFQNYEKLMSAMLSDKPDESFIGLYIKRGGKIGSKKYNRVGVVFFPLYEALTASKDRKVHGVRLRIKDIKLFKCILEYIFPDISNPEAWMVGVDSKVAASTVALLGASQLVIDRINLMVKSYKKALTEDLEEIDTSYMTYLEDIEGKKGEIQSIPDIATTPTKQTTASKAVQQSTQVNNNVQTAQTPPVQHHAPTQPTQHQLPTGVTGREHKSKGGKVDPRELLYGKGYQNAPHMQPPYGQPGMIQQGFAPQMQQPMYNQSVPGYGVPTPSQAYNSYPQQPMPVMQPGYQQGYQQPMQQPMYNPPMPGMMQQGYQQPATVSQPGTMRKW